MERNRVRDKRAVKLDHVLAKDYIPYKEGRPARQKVIGNEDVLNLRIALHTATSLQDFIEQV